MKYGYFTPAYRGYVAAQTRSNFAAAALYAASRGSYLLDLWCDMSNVARARNWALAMAVESGLDLLLMQDSDVYTEPDVNPLAVLEATLDGAAAVGAVVPLRDGKRVNVEPFRVDRAYDCDRIGTGLLLIDVNYIRQCRKSSGAWFANRFNGDGTEIEMSEDVHFCEQIRSAGGRVRANPTIPTRHLASEPYRWNGNADRNARTANG